MKLTLILLSLALLWQQYPKEIFMESWKKGNDRIQEAKLIIDVDNDKPSFSQVIKNIAGKEKYKLTCQPAYNRFNLIYGWKILLTQNGFFNKDNLLAYYSSDDHYILNYDDSSAIYNINFLMANETTDGKRISPDAFLINTRRIIKVENFYCIIQEKNIEFYDDNRTAIKSMKYEVDFTNSYDGPRTISSEW
jgi:hypothetical protein